MKLNPFGRGTPMQINDLDTRWRQLSEEVITGMKEWRLQHPRATFREIEAARCLALEGADIIALPKVGY
jgi:hypothetical protein